MDGSTDEEINTNGQKCNMDSVVSVNILNERGLNNCRYYFPNVTTLKTSYHSFCERRYSSSFCERCRPSTRREMPDFTNFNCETFDSTNLNRIIPLEKLTTLDIGLSGYLLSDIIEILQHTPNIHTLNITCMSKYNHESRLCVLNEHIRLVSLTNKIKKMKIVSDKTLETTKFLVMLCPRLKQLILGSRSKHLMLGPRVKPWMLTPPFRFQDFIDSLPTLLQFLLTKDNNDTRYLSSLLIESSQIETVKSFLESEKLHDICIKPSGSMICLWW